MRRQGSALTLLCLAQCLHAEVGVVEPCGEQILIYDAKIQIFDEKTNYYCGEIYVICNGILLNKFVAVRNNFTNFVFRIY